MTRWLPRVFCLLALATLPVPPAAAQAAGDAAAAAPMPAIGASGLPLPRFASLKSDRVNVRKGPGTDYPIAWTFQKVGWPVEIIKEFETWRQVRDDDGAVGWVQQNLLSGRRTAVVAPWDAKATPKPPPTPLMEARAKGGAVVALLAPGVLANVVECQAGWCLVSAGDQRGYVEQSKLFGVYPDETVK